MSSFKAGKSNYKAPDHKSSTIRKGPMGSGDSAGVESGLSSLAKFDGEAHGPMADYDVDPMTGNATERPEPIYDSSASKFGHSFDIC